GPDLHHPWLRAVWRALRERRGVHYLLRGRARRRERRAPVSQSDQPRLGPKTLPGRCVLRALPQVRAVADRAWRLTHSCSLLDRNERAWTSLAPGQGQPQVHAPEQLLPPDGSRILLLVLRLCVRAERSSVWGL